MPFDAQPTLEGRLLTLRPLAASDFQELRAVASDPFIWEQHPAKERAESAGFRSFFDESLASGGALVVIDASTGRIVGSSRFHGFDERAREVEIGWTFLAREHWGGTHNREMKRLMLEHAFRFVDRVVFLVAPRNVRSQRAMEKIGGVRAGLRRDPVKGENLVFEITAEDWGVGARREVPQTGRRSTTDGEP